MKILHITATRQLGAGQREQLSYEHSASRQLGNAEWTVVSLHCDTPQMSFEEQIPRCFRSVLLVRLYGWLYAVRNRKDYDIILFRDQQLDLFGPALGWLVRNRVTVHHSLEIAEMKLLDQPQVFKYFAVAIERFLKPITQLSSAGLVAVSKQILTHELSRFPWHKKRAATYPNGAEVPTEDFVDEVRGKKGKYKAVFIASKFTKWHGLDRLLQAVEQDPQNASNFIFELAGQLTPGQLSEIESSGANFVTHGELSHEALKKLLHSADVAIDSLALDRQGLYEASTLKVRTYLSAGLPVYSNHTDTAFIDEFPYYKYDKEGFSLINLKEFVDTTLHATRTEVREQAKPLIEKINIMEKLVEEMRSWV